MGKFNLICAFSALFVRHHFGLEFLEDFGELEGLAIFIKVRAPSCFNDFAYSEINWFRVKDRTLGLG